MEIKTSIENGTVPVTIMHIIGNIDSTSHETFTTKALELIHDGAKYILVDLTEAPFISSAGLRALHGIFKKLRSMYPDTDLSEIEFKKRIGKGAYKSPYLKLLNLSKDTQTAFELSGFDMFIETHTDMTEAIASF
jgi:anti-anti-sigma factor